MGSFSNIPIVRLDTDIEECVYVSLCLQVGSLFDQSYSGIAHFLEHALIEMAGLSYDINYFRLSGRTTFTSTIYYLELTNKKQLPQAINLMKEIYDGNNLNRIDIEKIRCDITQEYYRKSSNINFSNIRKLLGSAMLAKSPIGNIIDINNISINDLLNHHCTYYNALQNPIIMIVGYNDTIDLTPNFVLKKVNDLNSFRKIEKPFLENSNVTYYSQYINCNCVDYFFKITSIDRISMSVAFTIIEIYMKKFYAINYSIVVDVNITIANHTVDIQYATVRIINCDKCKPLSIVNKSEFTTYLFQQLSDEVLNIYLNEFKNTMLNDYIGNRQIFENAIRSYMYGEPLYIRSEFNKNISEITVCQVRESLVDLLKGRKLIYKNAPRRI